MLEDLELGVHYKRLFSTNELSSQPPGILNKYVTYITQTHHKCHTRHTNITNPLQPRCPEATGPLVVRSHLLFSLIFLHSLFLLFPTFPEMDEGNLKW